ncbi:MAG: SDR family oxidoreductase [Pseudomonadales bacterium]|nr:SDR family oxidoreductase [Pseudomonadales bacterium]
MTDSILLTGGTGKIGLALIHALSETDNTIVFTSQSQQKIAELESKYQNSTANIIGLVIDLCQHDSASLLSQKLENQGIQISALINNARSIDSLAIEPDGSSDRKNLLDEYLLDVIVPYELTMALANSNKHKLSRVINIGSQYGVVAANPHLYDDFHQQSPIQYGLAKAALNHLTKELAVRLAEKEITVNCIAFGGIEGRVDEAFKERYANLCPSGRMLKEEETVGPIRFLLSKDSSSINGQTISADGGWTIW